MKLLLALGLLSICLAFVFGTTPDPVSPTSTPKPQESTEIAPQQSSEAPPKASSEAPRSSTPTEAPHSSTSTEAPNGTSSEAPHETSTVSKQTSTETVDVSTQAEVTTVTPTPTPAPTPSTYHVAGKDGKVCIILKALIQFNITYVTNATNVTKGRNATLPFHLPPMNGSVEVTGTCTKDNSITIMFSPDNSSKTKDWMLFMDFKNDSNVYVDTFKVTYILRSELFPNLHPSLKDKNMTTSLVNQTYFEAADKNSFGCNSDIDIVVNPNVTLITSDLQVQAYRHEDNTTTFKGTIQQCQADVKTNNIVPIAVGAALAALVVIVLIAYLISRNRNKGGYESV